LSFVQGFGEEIKSTDGRRFEGKIVAVNEETLTVEKAGKTFNLKRDTLAPETNKLADDFLTNQIEEADRLNKKKGDPHRPVDPQLPNLDGPVDFPDALSYLDLKLKEIELIHKREDLMPSEKRELTTSIKGKLIRLNGTVWDVNTSNLAASGIVSVTIHAKCRLGKVSCELAFTGKDAEKAASFKKDQPINVVAEIERENGQGDTISRGVRNMYRILAIRKCKILD
jgi:hypothetical protein